jgi:hypothetical protein
MYGHATALLIPCTRPGCTRYGAALDDKGQRTCAVHALEDLRK